MKLNLLLLALVMTVVLLANIVQDRNTAALAERLTAIEQVLEIK